MNAPAKQVALCVGHSRKINGRTEGGAVSHDGKSNEWNYNLPLAIAIRLRLQQMGISAVIVSEYEGNGYTTAQRWLAAKLKEMDVSLAVELHFNCADWPSANGHEWLYWHSSTKSKLLAANIEREVAGALPTLKRRGIQPKTDSDRGAEFLRLTHCPAVICEPGFGSSSFDWKILQLQQRELADAIALGIAASLAG